MFMILLNAMNLFNLTFNSSMCGAGRGRVPHHNAFCNTVLQMLMKIVKWIFYACNNNKMFQKINLYLLKCIIYVTYKFKKFIFQV